MTFRHTFSFAATLAAALAITGCNTTEPQPRTTGNGPQKTIQPDNSSSGKSAVVSADKAPAPTQTELDALLAAAKRGELTAEGTVKQTTYFTQYDKNGRLWVFEEGSKALAEFKQHGEPAKSVTRPGGGPGGVTIRSADASTIDGYMAAIHACRACRTHDAGCHRRCSRTQRGRFRSHVHQARLLRCRR